MLLSGARLSFFFPPSHPWGGKAAGRAGDTDGHPFWREHGACSMSRPSLGRRDMNGEATGSSWSPAIPASGLRGPPSTGVMIKEQLVFVALMSRTHNVTWQLWRW